MSKPTTSTDNRVRKRPLEEECDASKRAKKARGQCPDTSLAISAVEPTQVHWADPLTVDHDPVKYDSLISVDDIWYSRKDYHDFMMERIRTIQGFRALGFDASKLDAQTETLRGLEPFRTVDSHNEMFRQREMHLRSVLLEQGKQRTLGKSDPTMLAKVVATHSQMALRRAQRLAALDQLEIHSTYPDVQPTEDMPANSGIIPGTSLSLSSSASIRRLQEENARRLMEIYQKPFSKSLSVFPVRRDSLLGAAGFGLRAFGVPQLRRDSLGTSSTSLGSLYRLPYRPEEFQRFSGIR